MTENKPVEEKIDPKEEKIEEVRTARQRLKEENDLLEAENARSENLRAESLNAGRSMMTKPVIETEDEKWAREAKERYKGTGLDPTR